MATTSRTRKSVKQRTLPAGKGDLVSLQLSITPALHAKLAHIAAQTRKSIPEVAVTLLEVQIPKHEKVVATIEKTIKQAFDDDYDNRLVPLLTRLFGGKARKRVSN